MAAEEDPVADQAPLDLTESVYVRTGRGRVHRAVIVDDNVLTNEQCNLDQAEERTLITSLAEVELEALCGICFAPAPKATETEGAS